MSTAAGLVLLLGAMASHEAIRETWFPYASEEAERWVARIAVMCAVLFATGMAATSESSIAQIVAHAFGLAAATLFPAIALGLFWPRATAQGAVAGMLAGLALTGGYLLWFGAIRPDLDVPAHWVLGVSTEGIGAVGMALHFAVSIAVSLATAPPSTAVQDRVALLRRSAS